MLMVALSDELMAAQMEQFEAALTVASMALLSAPTKVVLKVDATAVMRV